MSGKKSICVDKYFNLLLWFFKLEVGIRSVFFKIFTLKVDKQLKNVRRLITCPLLNPKGSYFIFYDFLSSSKSRESENSPWNSNSNVENGKSSVVKSTPRQQVNKSNKCYILLRVFTPFFDNFVSLPKISNIKQFHSSHVEQSESNWKFVPDLFKYFFFLKRNSDFKITVDFWISNF